MWGRAQFLYFFSSFWGQFGPVRPRPDEGFRFYVVCAHCIQSPGFFWSLLMFLALRPSCQWAPCALNLTRKTSRGWLLQLECRDCRCAGAAFWQISSLCLCGGVQVQQAAHVVLAVE